MHAEYLLVDQGGDGHRVEAVGKRLPQLDVVPALAFVVEPVDAVYGGALVVPPQDEEVLAVFDLQSQQEANRLERLLPAVHVIAEEEIIRVGREAAFFFFFLMCVVITYR